jgi:hypothetical protein
MACSRKEVLGNVMAYYLKEPGWPYAKATTADQLDPVKVRLSTLL